MEPITITLPLNSPNMPNMNGRVYENLDEMIQKSMDLRGGKLPITLEGTKQIGELTLDRSEVIGYITEFKDEEVLCEFIRESSKVPPIVDLHNSTIGIRYAASTNCPNKISSIINATLIKR